MKATRALFAGIGLMFVANLVVGYTHPQPDNYEQAHEWSAILDTHTCQTEGDFFHIVIHIEYADLPGDIIGQWNPQTDMITIEQRSIDVIAHEVHHMVDTMMQRYHIRDQHYASYLQGTFTECVYEVVLEDQKHGKNY